MKATFSLLFILCFSLIATAQTGLYIKYETIIESSNDEDEMLNSYMKGSYMAIVYNEKYSMTEIKTGTMMTMTMEVDAEKEEMLVLMSGMMGEKAYQGSTKELEENKDTEEAMEKLNVTLSEGTKTILGYECKKAIATIEAVKVIYWYTEAFKRPKNSPQIPEGIPGLCLEIETSQEQMLIKYTAIEILEDIDIADYKLKIPEGMEVEPLENMTKGF